MNTGVRAEVWRDDFLRPDLSRPSETGARTESGMATLFTLLSFS